MRLRIAIWGAGKFGQYVIKKLRNNSNIEIVCFLDRNKEIVGNLVEGIKVVHTEELLNIKNKMDCILVAFVNCIDLYDELREYNDVTFGFINNRIFFEELDINDDIKTEQNIFWVKNCKKPLLKTLETNIVDFCNLKCKGCSHFSNLYSKGEMISYDVFCRDLQQVSKNVNINRVNLLGGEALLNGRLLEYIEYTRKLLPFAEIRLITNGILLPKQSNKFFKTCLNNNIEIEISEYRPTKCVIGKIEEILNDYHIRYHIREGINSFSKNINMQGECDRQEAMQRCIQSGCNFLRNGNIYKCPFEALGNKFFEYYKLNIRLKGGIDIYNEDLDWDQVVRILEKEPVDSCKYCGEYEEFKWEVSNQPQMQDWIIN